MILINNKNDIGDWVEDIRRVFSEKFKIGLNRTRVQMIRLHRSPQHQVNASLNAHRTIVEYKYFFSFQMLHIEAINIDSDDWVFGCSATEVDSVQRYWYVFMLRNEFISNASSIATYFRF